MLHTLIVQFHFYIIVCAIRYYNHIIILYTAETLSRAVHTVTSISRASSTSSSSNRPLRSQFVSRCVPSDSARSQLEEYCCIHDKPPPSYQSVYCSERGRYIVKVYVAKTVGWVEGLQMSKKELAKESAANELLKKLNFYGNEN